MRIWDRATGKQVFAVKGHLYGARDVAFSPDGRHLADWRHNWPVKILDSSTGKELFSLKDSGYSSSLAFSPDGQWLATGNGKTVKIWDSGNGAKMFSLKGHAGPVDSVAFSPDGQRLASGSSDGAVKLWDITTNKEFCSIGSGPGYGEAWRLVPTTGVSLLRAIIRS